MENILYKIMLLTCVAGLIWQQLTESKKFNPNIH